MDENDRGERKMWKQWKIQTLKNRVYSYSCVQAEQTRLASANAAFSAYVRIWDLDLDSDSL